MPVPLVVSWFSRRRTLRLDRSVDTPPISQITVLLLVFPQRVPLGKKVDAEEESARGGRKS